MEILCRQKVKRVVDHYCMTMLRETIEHFANDEAFFNSISKYDTGDNYIQYHQRCLEGKRLIMSDMMGEVRKKAGSCLPKEAAYMAESFHRLMRLANSGTFGLPKCDDIMAYYKWWEHSHTNDSHPDATK